MGERRPIVCSLQFIGLGSMCYRSRLMINKFNARGSGFELERRFTKLGEITHSKGHYAVQGLSRSPILVQIES